ncbi:MAG TPA: hypothetical protein VM554_11625 [Acidisarcina sp.]|nr:hypothetical protein [Acidisarcina sp.]
MHKRTRTTLFVVLLMLAILAAGIYLRKKAPPEAARLLPESDGIVYLNLRPLRAATHFDQHPVAHDPEYQRFIDATGFVFERDLDEAAFALHEMPNPNGPNGLVAFSEVFVGRFDGKKLAKYFESQASSRETYYGHDVFDIPNEGRTVRVTQLGYDMVAVSNAPTAEQIHSICDRYRAAALPFAGSTLLSQHYGEIPLLSLAWGIGKIGLPLGENGNLKIYGMQVPLPEDTTFIASLRWTGALRLRVEEIAPTDLAASSTAESLENTLGLMRTVENNLPENSGNPEIRSLLDSMKVVHHRNRTVVTATLPDSLMQQLVAAPENMAPDTSTAPATDSQDGKK